MEAQVNNFIVKHFNAMIQFFIFIFNNISEVRSMAVAIVCAATGSTLGVISDPVLVATTDPAWFTAVSPFLQVGAWTVAMVAGLIAIVKACIRKKSSKNSE